MQDRRSQSAIAVNTLWSFHKSSQMKEISIEEAKRIAEDKNLHPGLVRGTDVIQFTKGGNPRVSIISWTRFEELLEKRRLRIMESKGWMKIFSRK